jgi:hypothetical protein
MEAVRTRVAVLLQQKQPDAFCDDCLRIMVGLKRRQQAQAVTSVLGDTPEFQRQVGACMSCEAEKTVTSYVGL